MGARTAAQPGLLHSFARMKRTQSTTKRKTNRCHRASKGGVGGMANMRTATTTHRVPTRTPCPTQDLKNPKITKTRCPQDPREGCLLCVVRLAKTRRRPMAPVPMWTVSPLLLLKRASRYLLPAKERWHVSGGAFSCFVWLTTRTEGPHGAYVRGAERNRIDAQWGEIERRTSRYILSLHVSRMRRTRAVKKSTPSKSRLQTRRGAQRKRHRLASTQAALQSSNRGRVCGRRGRREVGGVKWAA